MPATSARALSGAPVSTQINGFIEKFDPTIAKLTRACRSALRRRFPTARELVYDNYQALALGFCTTDRASDGIVSLAVMPRKVSLCFYYGATVHDPKELLTGGGNQVRFLRLESASTDTLGTPDHSRKSPAIGRVF
jgi:hypothetical protein